MGALIDASAPRGLTDDLDLFISHVPEDRVQQASARGLAWRPTSLPLCPQSQATTTLNPAASWCATALASA